MFSTKHLVKCITILLILGCGTSEVTVFNGSKFRCNKLFETLIHFNITATRALQESACSIKVEKSNFVKVNELFFKLDLNVFDVAIKPSSGLTEILVPVLKKSNLIEFKKLEKLRNSTGVLEIGCSEGDVVDSCTIWFISSQVKKEQIVNEVDKLFPASQSKNFNYEDLQNVIESSLRKETDQLKVSEKMIVLDPFSFRVLDGERDIAGAQLILVLGVFLLSGFVLGFWARSKEKRE